MSITQPLKYHGGKNYLASWLHELAPPSVNEDANHGYTHRNIGCAGGLAELMNWHPTEGISETVNDVNYEVANFWQVLGAERLFGQFQRRVEAIPFSEPEWDMSQLDTEPVDLHPLVNAAVKFFVRHRMSRQGIGRDYATPTRRTRRGMNENVSAWLTAVDGLPEVHGRMKRVEVRNLTVWEFIRICDHLRALFYFDPPYLKSTRSTGGGEYAFEMSERAHAILLAALSRRSLMNRRRFESLSGDEEFKTLQQFAGREFLGKFMLSGYRSDLYDESADANGWRRVDKTLDNKASGAAVKPKVCESVWMNY